MIILTPKIPSLLNPIKLFPSLIVNGCNTLVSLVTSLALNFFKDVFDFTAKTLILSIKCFLKVVALYSDRPTSPLSDGQLRKILQQIKDIDPEQINSILQLAKPLIDKKSASEATELLQALANIPRDEREHVVTVANPLIHNRHCYQKIEILQALTNATSDQREHIVAVAQTFFEKTNLPPHYHSKILERLASTPHDNRELIASAAETLIRENALSSLEASDIFLTLVDIPSDEREHVVEAARLFMEGRSQYGPYTSTVLKELANIPRDQREPIVATAKSLMSRREPTTAFEGARILRSLATVAPEQRGEIVHQINQELDQGSPQSILFLIYIKILLPLIQIQPPEPPDHTIDVHASGRDQKTREAIELLRTHQSSPLSQQEINKAVDHFIEYLDECGLSGPDKQLAKRALNGTREDGDHFGPLCDDVEFSIHGLSMKGNEILARLWIFALNLPQPDQNNVKFGMAKALKDSFDADSRMVCNPGKVQRLIVAVLSGRLDGVNIETALDRRPSTQDAIVMFFTPDRREIETLTPLLAAANDFCDQNPLVNREEFITLITQYAQLQGINDE